MDKITGHAFVKRLCADIKAGNASFLIGAGTSMVRPSTLPSGQKLKEIAFETLISGHRFKTDLEILRNNNNYHDLVPEILFTEIYGIIKHKIFPCFNILNYGKHNLLHRLFAFLISKYNCPVCTTNFDLFVEDFLPPNRKLYHLHGDLRNINGLYILLNKIDKGIHDTEWKGLKQKLRSKTLYVFGYSGNDKDILEFIRTSKVSEVVWTIRRSDQKRVTNNLKLLKDLTISLCYFDLTSLHREVSRLIPETSASRQWVPKRKRNPDAPVEHLLAEYKKNISYTESLLCLIQAHYRCGNYRRIELISNRYLKTTGITDDNRYEITSRLCSMLQFVPNATGRALKILDKVLKEKKVKKHPHYGLLLNAKGLLLQSILEKYPQYTRLAQITLEKALTFMLARHKAISRKDTVGRYNSEMYLSMVYNNLGLVYYEAGDYRSAKSNFLKSLSLKRKIYNIYGKISTYHNLAMLSLKTRSRSFQYWNSHAQFLMDRYKAHFRKIAYLKDIGMILLEHGKRTEGFEKLYAGLAIANEYLPESSTRREIITVLKNQDPSFSH